MLEAAAPVYMAVDVPSGEERITRKRATLDGIEFDKDEPAAKCVRADDFVAKGSMDELAGSWLRERGARRR